jgi:hypothetical protein
MHVSFFAAFYSACPVGQFGKFQCDQYCHCQNNYPCYPMAGTCFRTDYCDDGWLTVDPSGGIPDLFCNLRSKLFLHRLSLNDAFSCRKLGIIQRRSTYNEFFSMDGNHLSVYHARTIELERLIATYIGSSGHYQGVYNLMDC